MYIELSITMLMVSCYEELNDLPDDTIIVVFYTD